MKNILLLITIMLLNGCTTQYAGFSSKMNECGYPNIHYTKLHKCMCEKVVVSNRAGQDDYFAKTSRELLEQMNTYQAKVDKKQLTSKQASDNLNSYLSASAIQEQQSNKTAGAITAALLVGAAAAACAHNNCLGNGEGHQSYDGNCPCPYNYDSAGNLCGARSAYSRSGGASPACY